MSEWTARDDRDMECINEGYNQGKYDAVCEFLNDLIDISESAYMSEMLWDKIDKYQTIKENTYE